jgi:hypothetical protein
MWMCDNFPVVSLLGRVCGVSCRVVSLSVNQPFVFRYIKFKGAKYAKVATNSTIGRGSFVQASRVAQWVQCLATGWTTGRSRFDPRQRRKDFSSSLCVQTGSGAQPASCTMGTGGPFSGATRWKARDADHSPLLVPRSRMSSSYIFSPLSDCMANRGTAFILGDIKYMPPTSPLAPMATFCLRSGAW